MKQEDKSLLLQDLCARLPYGLIVELDEKFRFNKGTHTLVKELLDSYCVEGIKPYLRPMSSMTEEEKKELINIRPYYVNENDIVIGVQCNSFVQISECQEWLNKKMFDYRGLIEKGLALDAPDDMYNLKGK